MSARWYVVRVDEEKLQIFKAAKKPVFEPARGGWPRECNVNGEGGEDAAYAGGFLTGAMRLDVGFEDA